MHNLKNSNKFLFTLLLLTAICLGQSLSSANATSTPLKFLKENSKNYPNNPTNNLENQNQGLPIAVFHGVNGACEGFVDNWADYLGKQTNSYSRCLEYGAHSKSAYRSFESIGKTACDLLNSDDNFNGDFNIVGFSQGGLVARYIIEVCKIKGRIKNVLTFGSPHAGIELVPCHTDGYLKNLCYLGDLVLPYIFGKLPFLTRFFSPLSYFRSPLYEKLFEERSYLAYLNNEMKEKSDDFKKKFTSLEKLVLIKFSEDDMVRPNQSAWFMKFTKEYKLEEYKDSKFYMEDMLGLKYLNDNGRVEFVEFEGRHMHLRKNEMDKYVVPVLRGN